MNQKTKSGSGLIFAVVLLFVILGMVITLSSITVLETKMSQKTKSSVGAFYNSESGVEWALNKIATSTATNITGAFGAPGSGVSPAGADYKVYLLDKDGKVIIDGTLDLSEIKAVRSVGTQGAGGAADTQRAIEAAVAATGGASFTYYCNLSNDTLPNPSNICTNAGGTQGYCPSGFRQIHDLGSWGACHYNFDSGGNSFHFRPPGGGCLSAWNVDNSGKAYVCSQ